MPESIPAVTTDDLTAIEVEATPPTKADSANNVEAAATEPLIEELLIEPSITAKKKKRKRGNRKKTPTTEDSPGPSERQDKSIADTIVDPMEVHYPDLYSQVQDIQTLITMGVSVENDVLLKKRNSLFGSVMEIISKSTDVGIEIKDLQEYRKLMPALEALDALGNSYAPALLGMMSMVDYLSDDRAFDDAGAMGIIKAYQRSVERGFSQGLELLAWFATVSGYPQGISQSFNPDRAFFTPEHKRLRFNLPNKE